MIYDDANVLNEGTDVYACSLATRNRWYMIKLQISHCGTVGKHYQLVHLCHYPPNLVTQWFKNENNWPKFYFPQTFNKMICYFHYNFCNNLYSYTCLLVACFCSKTFLTGKTLNSRKKIRFR